MLVCIYIIVHSVNVVGCEEERDGVTVLEQQTALLPGSLLVTLIFSCTVSRLAVAQLVEALRYKPEGRGFDSRWCHWNFSLT